MQRHAELRGKIGTYEAAAEAATQEFKALLAASGYEKTKPVKEALFKKNDALAIAEELREALADSVRTALPIRAAASRAAQAFAGAHDKAYAAYAQLEVFKALAASEDGISRAMALLSHVPGDIEVDRHVQDVKAHRMRFVLSRLVEAAKQQPEAQTQPEVEELGPATRAVCGAGVPHASAGAAAATCGRCRGGLSVTMNLSRRMPATEKQKAPAMKSRPFLRSDPSCQALTRGPFTREMCHGIRRQTHAARLHAGL